MGSRLDLVVLNQGTTTTFRRPGYRETIIDISLASQRLAAQIEDWQVIEDYTGSDHMYITFRVRHGRPAPIPRKRSPPVEHRQDEPREIFLGDSTRTASQDGDKRHHESHRAGLLRGSAQEHIKSVKASCILVDGRDRGPS